MSIHLAGTMRRLCLAALAIAAMTSTATAAGLDEMSTERWAKLREVERYQLQIAEKYFREKNWKVALAEYEKYLALYERSEAGSYTQLKWSLCQLRLRKANTAIKEGFQSVIDYWPDSPEAVAAAYYIGQTYKDIGQIAKAKEAYRSVLADHPKHPATVYVMVDLVEIAGVEKDRDTQIELWTKLTFDAPRTQSRQLCEEASRQLAAHHFALGGFTDGVKALATSYSENRLPEEVAGRVRSAVGQLIAGAETRAKGEKLLSAAVAYLRKNMPSDTSEPGPKDVAKAYWFHIVGLYATAGQE
ncbi:MAG: tetratricopeptide repeat protein, partial [Planctomycetes bacterium]|nr:tetratricopeptide repeat protein [Planctomycetota bacterium]